MFYSHNFLARKGPLGTVWCAAHLQHKLKKSHYTSTDISSTVERIMFPEVPIALRMSGHLLLGVVRIYSKKVDYLYQDCNGILIWTRNTFSTAHVNLPEDATHAPFHSVTLPDTFDLDALELDDEYQEGFQDNHLRSQEEITLVDEQIPIGRDPYVVITFDEDIGKDPSHVEDAFGLGCKPMDEEFHPLVPESTTDIQGPGARLDDRVPEDSARENIPEIEVMRDAFHDVHMESIPIWPDKGKGADEPDQTSEQHIMKEKDIPTPVPEEMLYSGGHSSRSPQSQELPSVASEQAPGVSESHNLFGYVSPELAIRSTPPVEQPKQRARKRKQHYDKCVVLTNKFMKKALEDSSDLLRTKKQLDSSPLGFWKLNRMLKKDGIFSEPLITGLHTDLCDIYNKDLISAKSHLVRMELAHPKRTVAKSPEKSSGSMHDIDMEIELLRNNEDHTGNNFLPEAMISPTRQLSPVTGSMPRQTERDDFSIASHTNLVSPLDQMRSTLETGVLPTPDLGVSTGPLESEMETPMTSLGKWPDLDYTCLSDIPELDNSAGDLHFLEVDDLSHSGSQETPEVGFLSKKQMGTTEVGSLSARTRAVAQYLKRQSSATPISEDSSEDLSMLKILEGKSKKISARMFYETLVLKNYEFVDVKQEEPYGDITLTVTTRLAKEKFSS